MRCISRPASRRAASTSSRLRMIPSSMSARRYECIAFLASARSSWLGFLPQRMSRALCRSAWSGVWMRALARSSGRAQPSVMFSRSRKISKAFCQPGGHGLNAFPLPSSTRGMTKCSSGCPACPCRTQRIFRWSSASPAKATASKLSMTFRSCSAVTISSGCQERTPAVNFHVVSSESMSFRVRATFPRRTCGGHSFLPG